MADLASEIEGFGFSQAGTCAPPVVGLLRMNADRAPVGAVSVVDGDVDGVDPVVPGGVVLPVPDGVVAVVADGVVAVVADGVVVPVSGAVTVDVSGGVPAVGGGVVLELVGDTAGVFVKVHTTSAAPRSLGAGNGRVNSAPAPLDSGDPPLRHDHAIV